MTGQEIMLFFLVLNPAPPPSKIDREMLEATLEVMHDRAGHTRTDVEASIPFVEEGRGRGKKRKTFHFWDGIRRNEGKILKK